MEKEVSRQLHDHLYRGLIEPVHSALSSPVVLVRKKNRSWRFCVNYHKLNSVTIQDGYPLPRIDESLDALAGSEYFSTLDLLSGYLFELTAQDTSVQLQGLRRHPKTRAQDRSGMAGASRLWRLADRRPEKIGAKDVSPISQQCWLEKAFADSQS